MAIGGEPGVLAVAHHSRSEAGLHAVTHHALLQLLLRQVSHLLRHRKRAWVLPVSLDHARTMSSCLLATLPLSMHPALYTGLELGLDVDFLLDAKVLFSIEVRGVCARHIETLAVLKRTQAWDLHAWVVLYAVLRRSCARMR